MNIEQNLERILQSKSNIINSLQQKGSTILSTEKIDNISVYIDDLPTSGGGSADLPPLEQKYEGATCFRIKVPTNNYEFSLNMNHGNGYGEYDIDWGDGIIEHLNTYEQHHTYVESGTYDINIYNLSNDITLGLRFSETEYSYLFLNTNNLYWEGDYVIKDFPDICTDVIIGKGIIQIYDYTFAHLNELKSIIINDGLTHIGGNAFSYTPNLKTLVLPQTLTYLDTQTSMGIEELILPNSVTEISSITYCDNLKRIQFSDNLVGMYGSLNHNYSLEEVDFSNTKITSLPYDCFSVCKKLKKVVLPNTITELNWQMFSNCYSLDYFVVPNGITRIEYGCFWECRNLLQVELPTTLTYINNNAFYYNYLQVIISHALIAPQIESQTFYSENEDKHKYLYIHQNADIESYTSGYWGELLTKGWEIKYIEDIPTETTETSLKIKTKDNLPIVIDRIYFADLVDRQFVDDEYIFTFDNGMDKLPKNIYPKNELIGITLPNTLQYISYEQFRDCYNLEYVDIPNGVVSIGDRSFYQCSNLTEITIPSSLQNFGKDCFYQCTNLSKIECKCMQSPIIDGDMYMFFNGVPYGGTLYIYEGSQGFDEADSGWYQQLVENKRWTIEYMEMPQPNNEIWYTTNDGNIVNCSNLPSDNDLLSNTYSDGKGVMVFEKDLDEIPTNMFYFQSVESVSLPSSITTIGESAFGQCTKLNSINLPDGLTSIKSNAFSNTQKLREIILPNTLVTIGDGAFSGASLMSLVLPNSVTALPIDTFNGCYFSEIIIPSSITSIGDGCFAYCRYLHSITFNTNEPPFIDIYAFNNVGVWEREKPKVIYIPQGANIEAYQNSECATLLANGWTIEYI